MWIYIREVDDTDAEVDNGSISVGESVKVQFSTETPGTWTTRRDWLVKDVKTAKKRVVLEFGKRRWMKPSESDDPRVICKSRVIAGF